jgi:transposase-like protein
MMNIYSPERKAAVLARMMPPHNLSVNEIDRQEGIPANTLYGWRSQAGILIQNAGAKPPQQWSREARFAIVWKIIWERVRTALFPLALILSPHLQL